MAGINKVLIPIDGSDNSLRALAYLVKRVKQDKHVQICMLNVQLPIPQSLFVSRSMIDEHHELKSKEALTRARRLLAKNHVPAEAIIRIGDPAETIVKLARKSHCGEVVMGSRGLGRLAGLLLGSVTTKVIHLARMPVTVVP